MHFAMKILNGKICFSLRKFLAISPAIQKIASDCGCDAVVHLAIGLLGCSDCHTSVPRTPCAWYPNQCKDIANGALAFWGITPPSHVGFLTPTESPDFAQTLSFGEGLWREQTEWENLEYTALHEFTAQISFLTDFSLFLKRTTVDCWNRAS